MCRSTILGILSSLTQFSVVVIVSAIVYIVAEGFVVVVVAVIIKYVIARQKNAPVLLYCFIASELTEVLHIFLIPSRESS